MEKGPVAAMPFGGSQVELGHSRNPGRLRVSAPRPGLPRVMAPRSSLTVGRLSRVSSPQDPIRESPTPLRKPERYVQNRVRGACSATKSRWHHPLDETAGALLLGVRPDAAEREVFRDGCSRNIRRCSGRLATPGSIANDPGHLDARRTTNPRTPDSIALGPASRQRRMASRSAAAPITNRFRPASTVDRK
jgi:hypothetical protein